MWLETLDDDHEGTATRAVPQSCVAWWRWAAGGRGSGGAQQFPAKCESTGAKPIGQKAEVANAHESFGQNMQKESTLELDRSQRHYFLPVAVCIILPSESNSLSIERKQAVIGNGDPMGVSAQVAQHVDGVAKGRLGVNDPVFFVERTD